MRRCLRWLSSSLAWWTCAISTAPVCACCSAARATRWNLSFPAPLPLPEPRACSGGAFAAAFIAPAPIMFVDFFSAI